MEKNMKLKLCAGRYGLVVLMAAISCAVGQVHAASVRFSNHFSDNAVLQRDKPVMVRGFADNGVEVSVRFNGQTKKGTADDGGKWSVTLDPLPANAEGGDLIAEVEGAKATLSNVVVGDVILLARQTSVDVSLGRSKEGQRIAETTKLLPNLRVIQIKTIQSVEPREDLDPGATDGWHPMHKNTALTMSGSAYLLGMDLAKKLDVPVGIIDLNMGSLFTIGWMDRDSISSNNEYYGHSTHIVGYATLMEGSLETYNKYGGVRPSHIGVNKWVDGDPAQSPLYPSAGYNAVIKPMKGLTLKAAIVQLGNDYPYLAYEELRENGDLFDREKLIDAWWKTYTYRKRGYRAGFEVLPRIPALWRSYFNDDQLPFAFVMPPSSDNPTYAIHHHEIRELQRKTAMANPGVGLIVPDIAHIPFSGQPADDAVVANRTKAWMLGAVYGQEDVASSGPLFERMEIDFNNAQIFFKAGTADGLKASGNALEMFEAAGTDGVWFPATARLDGDTVKIECAGVNQIADIRYNYKKRPDYGLTNAQGLPAVPFRTGEHVWIDKPRVEDESLPSEYTTPADVWENDGPAIISGGGVGYHDGFGLLGPCGLWVTPFGPNMRVETVIEGSPADGKVEVGDLIYKVNGEYLEDHHLHQMGRAVALAESNAGAGKLALSLRRGNKLLDTELKLEVLGTISSTTPYDCPKSARIIANTEAYLAERGGGSTQYASGWLNTDLLFLLATGNPKYQGLVRRAVYGRINEAMTKGGTTGWSGSHHMLFLSEYYLATGDRNVLPALEKYVRKMEETQCRPGTFEGLDERAVGGWRHSYPGAKTYGMIPTIGLPAMIGLQLSKESGIEIDPEVFARGIHFFRDGQAEMGLTDYGAQLRYIESPEPLDPAKMVDGRMSSYNGSRALSAILFGLIGDTPVAHLNSLYCAYSWNTCQHGHGSNFFNGMWTPIGAAHHSKAAFINFMKNHYWFQDLRRLPSHNYKAAERSHGLGPMLALLVPRQRLRILGAPNSVFEANPSEVLKPALDAYYNRDYEKAAQMASDLQTGASVTSEERSKAKQLVRASRELQESIAFDIAKLEELVAAGEYGEASLDLMQLKGVMPAGDKRLAAMEEVMSRPEVQQAIPEARKEYDERMNQLRGGRGGNPAPAVDDVWESLVTVDGVSRESTPGMVDEGNATVWRALPVECVSQAPKDWTKPEFDDSGWTTGSMPLSWHLNHSLVARADFDVEDKESIKVLRISLQPYRQQNIVIYINGKKVAKFNQCAALQAWTHGELNETALNALKNGKNIIAVETTNDWRWGIRRGIMNQGFTLVLNAKRDQ
jgi:sialate O-acetylesterase